MSNAICCTFSLLDQIPVRKRTYEVVKEVVLKAGLFSVFDAMETAKSARLFDKLCKDPELERFDMQFPWCGIRRKVEVAR